MSIEVELEAQGVRVEYVIGQYADSAEGRLLKGLMGEFAEYERQKTLQRTKRGILRSVAAGNVVTGGCTGPYGYDIVQKGGQRTLGINEEEAEIVRVIFNRYAYEGDSISGISEYLTSHNVPLPRKGKNHQAVSRRKDWSTGTLDGILRNETYIGRWHYRKSRRVKQQNGKYTTIPRPRSEWLEIEVPAIVSEETFKLVQERREANKRRKRNRKHYTYALGGVVTCGYCGSSLSGIKAPGGYRYYKCNARHSHKRYGFKCDMPTIRIERLDATVWRWVKGILLNTDELWEAWEQHERQRLEDLQPYLGMIEANEAKLAKLREEKGRLIKAYTAGALTLDDLADEKTRLEKEIADTSKALEQLRADLEPNLPDPVERESIAEFAEHIRQGADLSDTDATEQREIYRLTHMAVKLVYENGQHYADVSCVLGKERLSTAFNASWHSDKASHL